MVTPDEMRAFSLECLRWAEETENASHRDLMIRVARTWMETASTLDCRAALGGEYAMPDLRNKLD